jgi:hypothetical protein
MAAGNNMPRHGRECRQDLSLFWTVSFRPAEIGIDRAVPYSALSATGGAARAAHMQEGDTASGNRNTGAFVYRNERYPLLIIHNPWSESELA